MAKLSDITINVSCNCENFKEEEPVKEGIKEDHAKEIKELTNDKEAFRLTYCEVFNERNKLKFENGELRGLLGRINEFVKLDGGA